MNWGEYSHAWAWAISVDWQIGAVTLLCALCIPLAAGFLVYHVYLVWAGMTTNESSKWTDWKEDIADDVVFRAEMKTLRDTYTPLPEDVEPREEDVRWPKGVRARWWLIRTRDGQAPVRKVNVDGKKEEEVPDERWERVHSLAEVQNVYDLGFWDNLWDGLFNRA